MPAPVTRLPSAPSLRDGHRPLRPGDPVVVRWSGIRGRLRSISDAAEHGLDGRMVAIIETAEGRLLPAWPSELARDDGRRWPRRPDPARRPVPCAS